MNILEHELEDVIYEMMVGGHPKLPEPMNYDHILRQFNLSKYGIVDLIGYTVKRVSTYKSTRTIHVDVGIFELKRGTVDINTFTQAFRYAKGVIEYLKYLSDKINKETIIEIDYLDVFNIGKEIDVTNESLCYLPEIMNTYHIYTYNFTIDGFELYNEKGYKLNTNKFSRNYKDIKGSLITHRYVGLF